MMTSVPELFELVDIGFWEVNFQQLYMPAFLDNTLLNFPNYEHALYTHKLITQHSFLFLLSPPISLQVIENSMMRFAKARATPDALDANGELLPAIRKELAHYEIENTWAAPSAWGFSIQYRSKTTVGSGSRAYTIPAG